MAEHRRTLADLEANGLDVRALTTEQQDVLRGLSDDELALLVTIRAKLDEVSPDVMAHSEVAGGALF
jgi:hypothetical protein